MLILLLNRGDAPSDHQGVVTSSAVLHMTGASTVSVGRRIVISSSAVLYMTGASTVSRNLVFAMSSSGFAAELLDATTNFKLERQL